MPVEDVLIVSQYTRVKSDGRFEFLANLLSPHVNRVELLTSSFRHVTKQPQLKIPGQSFDVTYVDEPGYSKNISLERIRSHRTLARNVRKYLNKRAKPDLIYCAVPSLDVAEVVGKFAEKNEIPLILDIQDLWPEAFELVVRHPAIARMLLAPLRRQANSVYRRADHIVAVSNTYASRALVPGGSRNKPLTVYLGTNLDAFDRVPAATDLRSHDDEVLIAYIGALGASYDLPTVIKAIEQAQRSTPIPLRLVAMGGGNRAESFKTLAIQSQIAADFLGWLSYEDMVANLRACDIAVNPIVKGSPASIINKVGDYAGAALPVLNTQESAEYRGLVDEYEAGINVAPEDPTDLAHAILTLVENPLIRTRFGAGNRRLAEEKFDREQTYPEILRLILSQASD